jgi:hypothetical protein
MFTSRVRDNSKGSFIDYFNLSRTSFYRSSLQETVSRWNARQRHHLIHDFESLTEPLAGVAYNHFGFDTGLPARLSGLDIGVRSQHCLS